MKGTVIIIIALLLIPLLAGCVALSFGAVSGQDVSDRLEMVPLGTSYEATLNSLPINTTKKSKAKRIGFLVYGYAAVDPTHEGESHMTMYRQYPSGVILDLIEDDYVFSPRISDNQFQSGVVYVFFDQNKRYKGFISYSHARYSVEKDRLNQERQTFKSLGLVEEARRARMVIDRYLKNGINKESLPTLPLRKNRAISIK